MAQDSTKADGPTSAMCVDRDFQENQPGLTEELPKGPRCSNQALPIRVRHRDTANQVGPRLRVPSQNVKRRTQEKETKKGRD